MERLLVVDDEPDLLLTILQHSFSAAKLEIRVARTAGEGLILARSWAPNVILLDIGLPDQNGLDLYRQLREFDARRLVIFITGTEAADTAIEAMKLGAYDYLFKPVAAAQLREVVAQALEISRLSQVPAIVPQGEPADERSDAIIGRCPAMGEVYKAIGRVADQNVTVLITGESGTGKELVARAVYQHSRRAQGPFLAINCAAIPESLLESELFGHEKGAFSGADRKRIGKFEQCNGGTLFLDEIGDMPLLTQSKLLRALQDQTFERVGGNDTIHTDVRLLAATNHTLEARVAQNRFRADLFYRLRVFSIHLPPLRERGDDLSLLVQHYLARFNRELGKAVTQIPPASMELLQRYAWPGNARELQGVLKQALLHATGPVLLPEFLPEHLRGTTPSPKAAPAERTDPVLSDRFIAERLETGTQELYDEVHRQTDRWLLPRILEHTQGNQFQAAKVLGISRSRLRHRLRELGLRVSTSIASDEHDEE